MEDNTKDSIRSYYDELSGSIDYKYTNPSIEHLRSVELSIVKDHLKGSSKVLDIGCGSGKSSVPLLELGHYVTMLDISRKMLELSRSRVRELGLEKNCMFVQGDIEDIELGCEMYDVALSSFGALNHVIDISGTLRNIGSCLVKGGWLVFSVANQFSIHRMSKFIAHCKPGIENIKLKKYQKLRVREASSRLWTRFYSKAELDSIIHTTGLEVESVSGVFFHLLPDYKRENNKLEEGLVALDDAHRSEWPANEFSEYIIYCCRRI